MVFGVGDYGSHEYEFQYTVTNMIKNLTDGQTLYWQFINSDLSVPPEKMEIIIKGFEPFTEEQVKMWSFGYSGNIQLDKERGIIFAASDKPLSSSSYGTILLQFPENYFDTSSSRDMNREELKKLAFEGSDYNKDNEENNSSSSSPFYYLPMVLLLLQFPIYLFLVLALRRRGRASLFNKLKKEYRDREMVLKGQYYRQLPYDGDLEDMVYVLDFMPSFDKNNILTLYLLKWIKEKAILLLSEKKGLLIKRESYSLKINHTPAFSSTGEETFFKIISSAKGEDEILEEKELKKYFKRNYFYYSSLIYSIEKDSLKTMKDKSYLEKIEDGRFRKISMDALTEEGKDLLDRNIMFRNYLMDYSLLNERDSYDVHLWEELLLYAALYGITEEVYKQSTIIAPEFERSSEFNLGDISSTRLYSSSIQNYYHRSPPSSSGSSSSRSSGGGGSSSSSGGGGGSSGGGSGGGTR